MNDDTHDQLVKIYLEYFKANEQFERAPSLRTKRNTRELLRKLRDLAKIRQNEIKEKYDIVLEDIRASGKWAGNIGKSKKTKK
jgi:hypothetical protein